MIRPEAAAATIPPTLATRFWRLLPLLSAALHIVVNNTGSLWQNAYAMCCAVLLASTTSASIGSTRSAGALTSGSRHRT
jgi:hypothetical protein